MQTLETPTKICGPKTAKLSPWQMQIQMLSTCVSDRVQGRCSKGPLRDYENMVHRCRVDRAEELESNEAIVAKRTLPLAGELSSSGGLAGTATSRCTTSTISTKITAASLVCRAVLIKSASAPAIHSTTTPVIAVASICRRLWPTRFNHDGFASHHVRVRSGGS